MLIRMLSASLLLAIKAGSSELTFVTLVRRGGRASRDSLDADVK